MKEKDETPEYEAESHSPSFLKKAEHLAKKKGGKAPKKVEVKHKRLKRKK